MTSTQTAKPALDLAVGKSRTLRRRLWWAACVLGGLHVCLYWLDWPSHPVWEPGLSLWRSQLAAGLSLVVIAIGLRPGVGRLLAGLVLNLAVAGALLAILGVILVARFS